MDLPVFVGGRLAASKQGRREKEIVRVKKRMTGTK